MTRFAYCLLPVVLSGCHPPLLAPPARPAPPLLPATPRQPVVPDVTAVPARPGSSTPRPTEYRRLTAADCRRLAIRNAPLADALDTHPENVPAGCHPDRVARADLARRVRGYAADEIRNRAAAEALTDFYRLLAAEGQLDLLLAARAELSQQLAAAEQAQRAGVAAGAEADDLRRRLLETDSQLARLEASIVLLNTSLAGRIGRDPADPLPLWPDDPFRVAAELPDADAAVRTALYYRPDLNLLRVLAHEDTAGDLTRAVLELTNPLLANVRPSNPLLAPLATLRQEPTRAQVALRRQVTELLATRERQAEAEVRAAVAAVRGALSAVAAKTAEVRNQEARLAEASQRAEAGVAGAPAELVSARLALLKLRGELIDAVADWHLAVVKLCQATGTLVRE